MKNPRIFFLKVILRGMCYKVILTLTNSLQNTTCLLSWIYEKQLRIFHKARKMAKIDAKFKGRLVVNMHQI